MKTEFDLAIEQRDEALAEFHKFFLMARSGVWDRRMELHAQAVLEEWGLDCSGEQEAQ